ncbi:MAG TPA: hypothetical protein VIT42_08995, partial [Microlunatus sp.]
MTSQPNVGVPQHEALPDFLLDEPQPGAVHDAHRNGVDDTERLTTMLHNVGRNLASLVGLFFVSLVAFIVCTTLFSVGAGLAIIVVGLFVLAGPPARLDQLRDHDLLVLGRRQLGVRWAGRSDVLVLESLPARRQR